MAIKTRDELKAYFETGDQPSEAQFVDVFDSVRLKSEAIVAADIGYGIDTLTPAATTAWNVNSNVSAKITLTQDITLAIVNPKAGQYYSLFITQDGTGNRTITLPANSIAPWGASNAIPMSYTAGTKSLLMFAYDGTNYWWLVKKDFAA